MSKPNINEPLSAKRLREINLMDLVERVATLEARVMALEEKNEDDESAERKAEHKALLKGRKCKCEWCES